MDWWRGLTGLMFFLILPSNIIGLWWVVGSPLTFDRNAICRRSKKLRGSSSQRDVCRKEPEVVEKVVEGTQIGLTECQYQLRYSKWNCTTVQNSVGKVLKQADTRETAFLNAMTSAGATYSVTQACSMGDLVQCGCADRPRKKKNHGTSEDKNDDLEGTWEWGGCDDNIEFGYSKSKEFMDAQQKKRNDIRTLITLHNNEAGRTVIRMNMFRECKCHGLSGSCTLQTCWRKMPSFRKVGNLLKEKFNGAAKVTGGNTGEEIIPEDSTVKFPTAADLVYSTDSPDYCRPNRKVGSLGTHGRRCNGSALDVGGCDILCCGRGATEYEFTRQEPCRCRFHWCCDVQCDTCKTTQVVHICNGYDTTPRKS
ncbi:Protein Wnt-6 [Holothuria leucospilota]|uniref:Protein Wnt n=1 Tax=Holothuria leucospilota TaxID=206669 RepID=A0A9Q0YBB1_HOLLE|nr:Protein Wnt-6 [Holothuria leucospilota]